MPTSFDDLRKLAHDLGDVPGVAPGNLRSAVQFNAQLVKDAWNKRLAGVGGHAKLTSNAISYDTEEKRDSVQAEIGALRGQGRQAGVVRLLENGSIKNPARGYGASSLLENRDDLERGTRKAVDDTLNRLGL